MNHDPLCYWTNPARGCQTCDLIARVREDERASMVTMPVDPSEWISPRLHTERMRENYDAGYAAALWDVTTAITGLQP